MRANRSLKVAFLFALAPVLLWVCDSTEVYSAGRSPQQYSNGVDRTYMWTTSVWSPDHKAQAHIQVAELIGTPEGANSCLYLDSRPVYPTAPPKDCNPHPRGIYDGIHVFLSQPEWSPDSRTVAIITRIFDWEYEDPFGRYWEGTLSNDRYYLVIASLDQPTLGYALKSSLSNPPSVQWVGNTRVTIDGRTFDLTAQPPTAIP